MKKKSKLKNSMNSFYGKPHEDNYNLMTDLLFSQTTQKGFKYLLVITDIYNFKFDIEPIKNKKSKTVLNAMLKIFKRPHLNRPEALYQLMLVQNVRSFYQIFI